MLLASDLMQAHQVPSMDFNLLQNYSWIGAPIFHLVSLGKMQDPTDSSLTGKEVGVTFTWQVFL